MEGQAYHAGMMSATGIEWMVTMRTWVHALRTASGQVDYAHMRAYRRGLTRMGQPAGEGTKPCTAGRVRMSCCDGLGTARLSGVNGCGGWVEGKREGCTAVRLGTV